MVIIRYVLFAFFVFVAATVAAFVNLKWYQAILASGLTFVTLCYLGLHVIRYSLRRVQRKFFQLFEVKGQVLKQASVDVHSVRAVIPTKQDLEEWSEQGQQIDPAGLSWYEIEFTLFPDAGHPGPMTHWDVDDLTLVPLTAKVPTGPVGANPEIEAVPMDVVRIENGEEYDLDDRKLQGSHRLRITVGLMRGISNWTFRYYGESFGQIRLPASIT